jgi:hypothetical protein
MHRQRFFQPFTQALCFAVASTMAQTGTIISISSSAVSSGKWPATWVIEFSRTLDAGGTQIGTVQVALTLEAVPRPNFGPMESMTFVSCATASRLEECWPVVAVVSGDFPFEQHVFPLWTLSDVVYDQVAAIFR